MALNPTLGKSAFSAGEYYLVDSDTVLEFYKKAGYNTDDDDEEVPNILELDGQECYFTGDYLRRGEKYYEIVIAAKGFKWDEIEHDDYDEEDEDYEE